MSSLRYVGKSSEADKDVVSRLRATNILNAATPNRSSVTTDVTNAVIPYATKTYIDTQDGTYALPSYYQQKDALNVPKSAKGQPNGVANLDADGKIPVTQIPALGAGYIYGPFGPTSTSVGTTSNVPLKIAEWLIGVPPFSFQPLVFGYITAQSALGRPVIEVRMSNGAAPYASQTRIGIGMGRSLYVDPQPIPIITAPAGINQVGSNPDWPASTNIVATAWLWDKDSQTSVVTSNAVFSASIFLMRTAE